MDTLAPKTKQTQTARLRTLISLRLLALLLVLLCQTPQPSIAHVRLELLNFFPVRLQFLNNLGVVVKGQRVEVCIRVLLLYLLVLRKVLSRVFERIE